MNEKKILEDKEGGKKTQEEQRSDQNWEHKIHASLRKRTRSKDHEIEILSTSSPSRRRRLEDDNCETRNKIKDLRRTLIEDETEKNINPPRFNIDSTKLLR